MALSLLHRQLSRVRRRLFALSLLSCLTWAWLLALACASLWLFLHPLVFSLAPPMLRWVVAGSLVGLGTLGGIILAILRQPTPVSAALALDDRFALKERVTTSLTLSTEEAGTPAGQALLADVESKLATVRVGDRFPVRMPTWPALLLPVGVLAVVLLALFWNPTTGAGSGLGDDLAGLPENQMDVDKQMQQLAVKPAAKKKAAEPPPSEELQRIQEEVERFARQPRETKDDIRERIKDATALEEQIRRQQKEQAERVDALKEQMKQVQRLTRKNREGNKEGPAKKAADALARADMEQARDELERLSRELEKEKQKEEEKERLKRKKRDPNASEEEKKQAEDELNRLEREQNLTQKEREQLARQLEDMEEQLQRLTRKKEDIAKELRDLAEKGEIDKDELDRELDQLEKNAEQLAKDKKDLEDLLEELKQCRKCMNEGKDGEAAECLARAARKAGKLGKDGENAEMARKLVQIRQVKKALCRAAGTGGGPGAGRRPEQKDDTDHKDTLIKGEWDKGKLEAVGQGPFGGFKGPRKPAELKEEIQQATQEAPAALDRQRLPAAAKKMARGYFEKVRGPDEKKK